MVKVGKAIMDYINNIQYPIGRVVMFYDNEDHSNYLGFRWTRTAIGRVPVGISTTDAEFNTIGKTGGSKYLQEHNHAIISGNRTAAWEAPNFTMSYQYQSGDPVVTTAAIQPAGTGNSGNLQPYEVMAFWRRIS